MTIKKQVKVFLLIIGMIVLVGGISFSAFSGGPPNWNHVTFTIHRNAFKFFDHNTGKIYDYDALDGKLREVWVLEELGSDLTKIKSRKKRR